MFQGSLTWCKKKPCRLINMQIKMRSCRMNSTEGLTCVFVTLEHEKGLRLVQCENTYVIIISTCGDESSRVSLTWCYHAYTGYKICVTGHTVHLCESCVRAVRRRAQRAESSFKYSHWCGNQWVTLVLSRVLRRISSWAQLESPEHGEL